MSLLTKVSPIMKSLVVNGSRACLRPTTVSSFNTSAGLNNSSGLQPKSSTVLTIGASPHSVNRLATQNLHTTSAANDYNGPRDNLANEKQASIGDILEREIQDESAEMNQQLSSEQFPGFSVETDDADVKLTKQVGNSTVTVRFTVSSSLNEWPVEGQDQQEEGAPGTTLVSMPEFQVQISKDNHTLEMSCYFEEMDQQDESGEPYVLDPVFGIDELVMYEGEPKETEFAVSAEYFQDDLQTALLQYLSDHGIDEEFAKNLVGFATSYEKKQYIGLLRRLKGFVSK